MGGEEVMGEDEGGEEEEEGDQEESPVRKQSMFKDIFEEPKEQDGERKIQVFSKASRIPSKPSGVGLAEMMKSRLNRIDSDKEVVVEQEVIRRRSGERSISEVRSKSRSRSRNGSSKKKSKGKKNKSRSRSKDRKKKKKYSRSSSSPASSPEKRK